MYRAEWGSSNAVSAQQRQRLHQHPPFFRRHLCTAGMHPTPLSTSQTCLQACAVLRYPDTTAGCSQCPCSWSLEKALSCNGHTVCRWDGTRAVQCHGCRLHTATSSAGGALQVLLPTVEAAQITLLTAPTHAPSRSALSSSPYAAPAAVPMHAHDLSNIPSATHVGHHPLSGAPAPLHADSGYPCVQTQLRLSVTSVHTARVGRILEALLATQ